jgi:G:T-mismatch repair DNA endonuclease (very short patch repair protein)
MQDYCLQDVRVLLSCVQVSIQQYIKLFQFDGMAETCTIAGKSILIFRHSFLKKDTIALVSQDGYGGHRQQSREGLLWLLQQEVTLFPGMQHARSTHGEKSVCGAPVDGFHAASNTVLQYHGCFYHGCPKCYPDGGAINKLSQKTFHYLNLKTAKRTAQLRKKGYTVIEKWACEFTPAERLQASSLGLESQLPQLDPKESFYGGRTEAITLSTQSSATKKISYLDVTSEYPYVNACKEYPVGHPITMLKHQLPQNNADWTGAHLFGLVLCTIIPLYSYFIPCFPIVSGKVLCFPCAPSVVMIRLRLLVFIPMRREPFQAPGLQLK